MNLLVATAGFIILTSLFVLMLLCAIWWEYLY